jgi:hypothetical protein
MDNVIIVMVVGFILTLWRISGIGGGIDIIIMEL